VNEDDHTVIATYGAEYRGLVEYYLLAGDVSRLNRLEWVMSTSLLKTLACKHDSTVAKMAARYRACGCPKPSHTAADLVISHRRCRSMIHRWRRG
jgi:hypothetical protein